MKKIAIITLTDYKNYGNRLQNYALIKVIEKLNFSSYTIVNQNEKIKLKKSTLRRLTKKNIFLRKMYFFIKYKVLKKKPYNYSLINNKIEKFKSFSKLYLNEKEYYYNNETVKKEFDGYNYCVVGSDQVWNPVFNLPKLYFLGFVSKEKRVSYAASFGVSKIPFIYKNLYKRYLKDFDNLSVREEAGAKIIKELVGKNAYVHLDPTLLLTKDEWNLLKKEARYKPNKKYILLYILGELSLEQKEFIEQLSIDKDFEIVSLADINDEKRYDADPSEFLDYISSCSLLFTDSFHGTVFSILFNKPFIIIDRVTKGQSMNSRIETLLKMFQLEDRHWNQVLNSKDYFDVSYDHIEGILEKERKKSFEYLKDVLKVKKED